MDLLRETIMFPVEQVAVRETLSQQFSNNMEGPISIEKSLSNYVLNQMFPDLWSTIWTPFSLFGCVSAGLFMLLKLVKFFLDVLANAYMLYTVHGWSFRLFGAFWISFANVSLREVEKKEEEKEEIMELMETRKKLRTPKRVSTLEVDTRFGIHSRRRIAVAIPTLNCTKVEPPSGSLMTKRSTLSMLWGPLSLSQ